MKKLLYLFLLVAFGLTGCSDTLTSPSSSGNSNDAPQLTHGNNGGAVPLAACTIIVPDDYATVQGAVNAASAGDNVCVKPDDDGIYQEQVVVNKDLTLTGISSPTILAPEDPAAFTIPESDPTWEPIVFAFGGTSAGGDISGTETVDVSISGFTVDGNDVQPEAQRSVGILYRNVQSSGSIAENTVENMGVGGKETFGILAYGDTKVTIAGNTIKDYERGGIGANGDGGTHPAPEVVITGNSVTGTTGINEAWGPNGIQIGFGAAGRITNNDVADNRYGDTPATAASAGIIVFGSSDVMVRGNRVTNSDIALATAAAGNNELAENEVSDAFYGAFLVQVDNNKLVNNAFSDPDGGPDGSVGVLNTGENNKLINNSISGFDTDVTDLGTDSKVHANSP